MKFYLSLGFLFACLMPYTILAQNNQTIALAGKVVDKETNQALAYVSIGLLNKPKGTVTDSTGQFSFDIDDSYLADTIQLSFIGYASKKIAIADYRAQNDKIIEIEVKIMELEAVVVTNARLYTETIGRQGSGKLLQVKLHNKNGVKETIGSELGMRYYTDNQNAILKDVNFYISSNNFNSIKFRINVYSVKDDMPDTLISRKQVLVSVDSFKTGWSRFDVEKYNIRVVKDFIVTFQWVESKMDKPGTPVTIVPIAMTLFSKKCYARVASQDKWKRLGISLSSYVTLAY